MATYVNDLRLTELATGEASGSWGTTTNTNLELIGESLGYGTEGITTNADTHTSTVADGATDPVRAMFVKYTGTLDSACTITIAPNTLNRMQFIENGTSGSQNIIISQGSGANITIPPGDVKAVYLDGAGSGAAVVDAFASLSVVDLKVQDDLTVTGDLDVDGTANLDILDIDGALTQDGGAVFNEDSADVDFRVESNGDAHRLFIDGGNDRLLIGTTASRVMSGVTTDFFIEGTAYGDSSIGAVINANGVLNSPGLFFGKSRGTSLGSNTVVQNNDRLFTMRIDGSDGTNLEQAAIIEAYVDGSPADNSIPGRLIFMTTNAGAQYATEKFRISADGSLSTPTLGTSNVRFGVNAGNSIASGGNYNVVVGDEAGTALTTGDGNIAVGFEALKTEDSGGSNVAIGYQSLKVLDAGTDASNIAIGYQAGVTMSTGVENIIIGSLAGDALTSGGGNIAIGFKSLSTEDAHGTNTAVGYKTLETLNAGANAYNVAIGYQAGVSATTGVYNTLIGGNAGDAVTTGGYNTAVGGNSLTTLSTGSDNTGIGYGALFAATTSSNNTAVGHGSQENTTTGASNTSVGADSLKQNTTGTLNTAVGTSALTANTTGSYNTAIGQISGDAITTGESNTAVGYGSGSGISTSDNNTTIGGSCAATLSTGAGNTCLGASAANSGTLLTTGSENIVIGLAARTSAGDVDNEIVMGSSVQGTGNQTFVFGDGTLDTNCSMGGTTWANPSDVRIKEEIEDEVVGLSFINDLRPRTFRYRKEKDIPEALNAHVADSEKRYKTDKYEHGFVAQEVKEAIDKHSALKDGFDMWAEDVNDGRQRVGPTAVIPMLVKAIQELSAEVEKLKGA